MRQARFSSVEIGGKNIFLTQLSDFNSLAFTNITADCKIFLRIGVDYSFCRCKDGICILENAGV